MKKYSFIKQQGYKDCGPACLEAIIEFYGGYISFNQLCEMTKTDKNGTSAYHLVEAAKQIGFDSYGMHFKVSDFEHEELILPAIAHVLIDNIYQHFIVIYEINVKKKTITIMDPMKGILKMKWSEFEVIFQGVVLFFIPVRNIEKQEKISVYHTLKTLIHSNRKHYIYLLIMTIVILILSFLHLHFIKEFINLSKSIPYKLFFLCIILIVLKNSLEYFRKIKILHLNIKINQKFIEETFLKILLLPYPYYRNRTTGEIVSRVEEASKIGDFISFGIIFLTDLCLCFLSGVLLFSIYSVFLGLSILLCIISVVIFLYFKPKIKINMNLAKQLRSEVNSFLVESITGFESVKGTNSESYFFQKFREKYENYLTHIQLYEKMKRREERIFQNIEELGLLVVLGIGLFLVEKNLLNFGDLLVISTLVPYFLKPCLDFNDFYIEIEDILISIRRVLELQKTSIERKLVKKISNIECKHLSYSYKENKNILSNVNLKILKYSKNMIIGPSGKGKSTLLKLIKQYYITDHIFINQKESKLQNINPHVVYISQNEYLFTDTLYNNITLGKDVSTKQIDNIIEICALDSILSKSPFGIHQIIEENGFNLSGGERQRIVLARALLNYFQILLIDEGLSQVDINLERKILKKLFHYFPCKTILFVSHRLENQDLFDQLIKIEDSVQSICKNNC